MKPLRVYIDASVVGGCLDSEFRYPSVQLFERFRNGTMIAVVSDLAALEVSRAPLSVRAVLNQVPAAHREEVMVTLEAKELAERYIAAGVIGRAMWMDARHIATATVHRVDVLASWNFKHIVNTRRMKGYNSVNTLAARQPLQIRTPAEVIGYAR